MPSQEPTRPVGWHSRRHQTSEANQQARERYGTRKQRQERRRLRALRSREQQLTRYMFGDFQPMDHLPAQTQENKIGRAKADLDNLRRKVAVGAP